MSAAVVRFRIDFSADAFLGPGKIDLLEAVCRSGSISQAGRDLGMSYRRAWLLVDSLNNSFRERVTVAVTGGKGGGGVQLTTFGMDLVKRYRALERDIDKIAQKRFRGVSLAANQRILKPQKRRALVRPLSPNKA